MSRESSQTITRWGEDAFGPVTSLSPLVERAQLELNELREAVQSGEADKDIALEAADVAILLHRLAGTLGLELSALVDEKMAVNRNRNWQPSGDGTGQHT